MNNKEWIQTLPDESKKLWKNNELCPVCGSPVDCNILACETGYFYCSLECCKDHVEENRPDGGY